MSVTDAVITKLAQLPPEDQEKVLEFIDSLQPQPRQRPRGENLYGLWASWNLDITEQEIADARREMWGNTPREDI